MREIFEFRIDEGLASASLSEGNGQTVGSWIRLVKVERSDPLFQKIGQLQFKMKHQRRTFFLSWNIRREYSQEEILKAEFFHVAVDTLLQHDEISSEYDDSKDCQFCGAGASLRSPLILKRPMKKKVEIARTIEGELVVSSKVVALLRANRITGCEWNPVYVMSKGSTKESEDFFHLRVTGGPFEVLGPTQFGIDPFDPDVDGEFRCRLSHKYGLNLLSEIYFGVSPKKLADIMHSVGFIGDRRGLLRPTHLIIASARLAKLLWDAKVGTRTEVAHKAS
jgi:hypothetical protein